MKNRLNAIEIGIFSIISIIFINSVYSLISNKDVDLHSNTREIASLASPTPSGTNASDSLIEFNCNKDEVEIFETKSPKIRIAGNICRQEGLTSPIQETRVENPSLATKFKATIFNDVINDRFSTDFIPLKEDSLNKIDLEFEFKAGQKIKSEILIKKKRPN